MSKQHVVYPLFQTIRFEYEPDNMSSRLTTKKLGFLIWDLVKIKFSPYTLKSY
jgi:hypothetical protein